MQDILRQPETRQRKARPSPVTLLVGAVVLLAVLVSLWALLHPPQNSGSMQRKETVNRNMAAAEQEYLKSLQIGNIALSRAENFIHQEVTILNAEVVNSGPLPVQALSVTVEFSDDMKQVVLRDTRGVLGTPPALLKPGERRPFEISFEHVPASWNMQQPLVYVSYLRLASAK